MKAKLFLLVLFVPFLSFAQNMITNPGFEDWQTTILTEYPENWGIFKLSRTVGNYPEKIIGDAQDGQTSVKLQTVDNGAGGFSYSALFYGYLPGYNGIFTFTGIPLNQTVDKLHFWYKGETKAGDNGNLWFFSFNADNSVDNIMAPYNYTSEDWTHAEIPINSSALNLESVFIGFTSGSENAPEAGSWVQIDNVYFTYGDDPTPI